MAAVNRHTQPLAPAPSPKYATLWEVYLREGGSPRAPLARALLSDVNVELLTSALKLKARVKLGALSPPEQDLTLTHCDAFANALMQGALKMGFMGVTDATLAAANKQIMEWIMVRLTTEQSTFARWRDFMERGVPLDERPDMDTERAERKELMRPVMGHGLYSPWEAYAEQRHLIDEFRPFNGLTPQDVTDSDDMRVQLVPWAPPAVNGRIPWGRH